jgi:hypothetical protein
MLSIRYGDKVAADFRQLVESLPPDAVASPLRSTVPLIDFWRTPESRLVQISAVTGIPMAPPTEMCFEYAVPVQRGRGKASFTDLMIIANSAVVAIEAKFTEPRGESVGVWLRDPPEANRREGLEGWLDLIRGVMGTSLRVDKVKDLPYQLVHRTASVCSVACSVSRPVRAVVYQVFGPRLLDYYLNTVSDLWQVLGRTAALEFHVLSCPLKSLPPHEKLAKRWNQGERLMGDAVREALLKGPIFSFGEPMRQFLPG